MSAEMRRRLIDHARRHMAQKRGGRVIHEPLDSSVTATAPDDASEIEARLSRLDEALAKLNADFPRALQVVQLRFLAGLTAEETASQLDLSVGTVKRDWDIRPCMARSRDGIRRQGLSQHREATQQNSVRRLKCSSCGTGEEQFPRHRGACPR